MSQIQTRNPATGEVLETYEVMSEQEVFAKIDSAHEAFLDWRSKSHEERAPYLRKIAGVLRDNSERFSELMTREMGKLLRDGKTEVELCAR
ncbi:MAG TPA: succinate-semialdehyde dehydrogenase, partial [Erythrobacter sp.]|nr:succinate-semialdehyde dehydrogenase [Erythrobacter sp.]